MGPSKVIKTVTAKGKAKSKAVAKASPQKQPKAAQKAAPEASKKSQSTKTKEEEKDKEEGRQVVAASAGALAQHNNLQEAIEKYQKGKLSADQLHEIFVQSSNKDTQKHWKGFEYHRNRDEKAKADWDELSSLGKGEGKESKKRMLLLAWLKEKKFGAHYFTQSTKLASVKTQTKDLKWLTWQELQTKHGEAEAKARVVAGTLKARKDPTDPRFWQFLSETQSCQVSLTQAKELNVLNTGKMATKDVEALLVAISSPQEEGMMEDMWNADSMDFQVKDLQQSVQGDDQEDKEEEEDDEMAGLPAGLKVVLGAGNKPQAKAKAKAKITPEAKAAAAREAKELAFQKRIDALTEMGDDTHQDQALRKVSLMHSLASKADLTLRGVVAAGNRAKITIPPAMQKQISSCLFKMGKALEKMGAQVVKRVSVEAAKEQLVATALLLQEQHKLVLDLQALTKGA